MDDFLEFIDEVTDEIRLSDDAASNLSYELRDLADRFETVYAALYNRLDDLERFRSDFRELRERVKDWMEMRADVIDAEERSGIPHPDDWAEVTMRAEEILLDLAKSIFVL